MVTWPAELPQKQFIGLTDEAQDAVIRTPMDTGPNTRRSRFSAVSRDVDVPIVVTGAQRQVFDTFYNDDLQNGALSFDWEDPVTDTTVEFAFRRPVKWSLASGGDTDERKWSGTLMLEIQP